MEKSGIVSYEQVHVVDCVEDFRPTVLLIDQNNKVTEVLKSEKHGKNV